MQWNIGGAYETGMSEFHHAMYKFLCLVLLLLSICKFHIIESLFGKYGRVDRVDMKSGFAFIYMEDEQDAEDAIRGLECKSISR